MVGKLQSFLRTRYYILLKKWRRRFGRLDLIYKLEDLTLSNYERVKGDEGLEHQIGRLTNFKRILEEVTYGHHMGDIVEFGTWQGFSLLWLAYLSQYWGIYPRIFGLDGFVGLPYADGGFRVGQFWDASLKRVTRNLMRSRYLTSETKSRISVNQALFSEKEKILSILGGKKFVIIHIDCDVSQSAKEIFEILDGGDLMADTCYLLFDDYGCPTDLKGVVDAYLASLSEKFIVKEHSSTRYTKNFKLTKITV